MHKRHRPPASRCNRTGHDRTLDFTRAELHRSSRESTCVDRWLAQECKDDRTIKITADKAKRDEAIQRFLKTGGQPPEGAKLLGRWTAADFSHGYDLLESDDAKPLTQFALEWSDLVEQHITPVIEDRELAEVLSRSGR